jgi:spore coat protein H
MVGRKRSGLEGSILRPGPSSRRRAASALSLVLALLLLTSCRADPVGAEAAREQELAARLFNPDWTEITHGKTQPRYAVVFPQDAVNTMEIVMTSEQWAAMREDMRELWGFDFGSGQAGRCCMPSPPEEPAYFDVVFRFNGREWKHVGFRLKGNSSLQTAWSSGIYKLPFRLQFDEFEDSIPEIRNQRF